VLSEAMMADLAASRPAPGDTEEEFDEASQTPLARPTGVGARHDHDQDHDQDQDHAHDHDHDHERAPLEVRAPHDQPVEDDDLEEAPVPRFGLRIAGVVGFVLFVSLGVVALVAGGRKDDPKKPPATVAQPGTSTAPGEIAANPPPGEAKANPPSPGEVAANPPPGEAKANPPSPGEVAANPPPAEAKANPPSPGEVAANPPPGEAKANPPAPSEAKANPPAETKVVEPARPGSDVKVASPAQADEAEYRTLVDEGRALYKRGQAKKAIASLEKAVTLKADGDEALVLLANCHLDRGAVQKALAAANLAVAANTQNADAYLVIGAVQQQLEHVPEAKSAYQTYLKLAPKGPFAGEIRSILTSLH
jgi:Flp pilus assembly protein TadD